MKRGPSAVTVTTQTGDGAFYFSYRTRTGAIDLHYGIETSLDLKAWEAAGTEIQTLSEVPQPDGCTLVSSRLSPASANTPRFVRVVVSGGTR
jgi:hypothetical protein